MAKDVIGRRVYPREDGWLVYGGIDQPARYGRATNPRVQGSRAGWWQISAPDGSVGSIDPSIHEVEEHDDGTITVTPSIDFSARKAGAWHGWLVRGVFKPA
jgi:hypothetical protein